MAAVVGAAAGGAAAATAMTSAAVLVHGYLVMEPSELLKLLDRMERPVVVLVVKREGVLHKRDTYIYAVRYGDFTVLTKTETPLLLPSNAEVIRAKDIILPPDVLTRLNAIAKKSPTSSTKP